MTIEESLHIFLSNGAELRCVVLFFFDRQGGTLGTRIRRSGDEHCGLQDITIPYRCLGCVTVVVLMQLGSEQ